jgi:hypothetical protein
MWRRFTVFGAGGKIIYSVKIANAMWTDDEITPVALPLLEALGKNLPEELASALSADVRAFNAYAKKKYREMPITPKEEIPPDPE